MKAYRGCGGNAPHFLDPVVSGGDVISITPLTAFTPQGFPQVPMLFDAGWAPGPLSPLEKFPDLNRPGIEPGTLSMVVRRVTD